MVQHAMSVVGLLVFVGISWLLSTHRRSVAWKTIATRRSSESRVARISRGNACDTDDRMHSGYL